MEQRNQTFTPTPTDAFTSAVEVNTTLDDNNQPNQLGSREATTLTSRQRNYVAPISKPDVEPAGIWKFLKRSFFNAEVAQVAHEHAQQIIKRQTIVDKFDALPLENQEPHSPSRHRLNSWFSAAYEDTYGKIGLTALVGMPFLSSVVPVPPSKLPAPPFRRKEVIINSWDEIWENFAGWREKHGLGFNVLKALIMIPLNIALIPVRMAINIIRFGTGLIPAFFKHMFNSLAVEAWELGDKKGSLPYFIGSALAFFLFLPFKLFQVIERAILAPQDSVRAAWEAGKDLAGDGRVGKVVSFLFTLISATITGLAYAILFPLLVKFILTSAPPATLEAITATLEPLSSIGDGLDVIVTPIVQWMGLEAAASSWVALSAIVGVGIGHTIVAAELAGKKIQDFFDKPPSYESISEETKKEDAEDDAGCCDGCASWLMVALSGEGHMRSHIEEGSANTKIKGPLHNQLDEQDSHLERTESFGSSSHTVS